MKYDIVLVMDLYSLGYHNKNNFNIIRALIFFSEMCFFAELLFSLNLQLCLNLDLEKSLVLKGNRTRGRETLGRKTLGRNPRRVDTRAKSSKGRH